MIVSENIRDNYKTLKKKINKRKRPEMLKLFPDHRRTKR